MITYNPELHAENIRKLNARNDAVDALQRHSTQRKVRRPRVGSVLPPLIAKQFASVPRLA